MSKRGGGANTNAGASDKFRNEKQPQQSPSRPANKRIGTPPLAIDKKPLPIKTPAKPSNAKPPAPRRPSLLPLAPLPLQ
jgi:hypothetical protein